MDTVTIPREEYEHLKKLEKVDWDLIGKFKQSLDDVKAGRVKRVR